MKTLKKLLLLMVSLFFLSCTAVLSEETTVDRDFYDTTIYYVYGGSYYRYWYNGTWTYYPISYGYTWRPNWHPHHQHWHHDNGTHRPVGTHNDNAHHRGYHPKPNIGHSTNPRPNTGHQRPQMHGGGVTHSQPNYRPSGRPNSGSTAPRTNGNVSHSVRTNPNQGQGGTRSFGNGHR